MFLEKWNHNNNDTFVSSRTHSNENVIVQRHHQQRQDDTSQGKFPRVLALYFPQFHQEPLNDEFWGEGFTDWNNLRAAPAKNRIGFQIPRPTELGYYDLANDTHVRKKQGELAKDYGIDGFAYHHYWFYDKKHPGPNIHAPLMQMLKDGHPNLPFCLHWCAMKWMSTWHGKTREGYKLPRDGVMQKQFFPSNETDPEITEHYNWLRQFFHHPNYIKVQGQPLFMLYQKKPSALPVLKRLRQLAIEDGFPGLFFTVGLSKPHYHLEYLNKNLTGLKLHWMRDLILRMMNSGIFNKTVAYPNPSDWNENYTLTIPGWCLETDANFPDNRMELSTAVEIPGIINSFDNTPRRNFEEARIWSKEEPTKVLEKFQQNLHAALYYEACCRHPNRTEANNPMESRFVMINAWNEWAEGMTLEPSDVYGRNFLQVIQDTKQKIRSKGCMDIISPN